MSVAQDRALIVLTSATPQMPDNLPSGYFFSEVAEPFDAFIEAGYAVDACSETGSASVDPHSLEPAMMGKELFEKVWQNKSHPVHNMLANVKVASSLKAEDYKIIFFAGGHATLWDFPTAKTVQKMAADIYEKGGVVSAVCHGPAALGGIILSNGEHLLKDKKATGFSSKAEQDMKLYDFLRSQRVLLCNDIIQQAGGVWREHDTNPMGEFVIESGRLVTGENPASASKTAKAALSALKNGPKFS